MSRAEIRQTGCRQGWEIFGRRTRKKIGCEEEENRFVQSLDLRWVDAGRKGFSWVWEKMLGKKRAKEWNIYGL